MQVNRRVVYRASAGCVDRLGTVIWVHETFMNEKYCYTYSVQLDPIIVNSSSLQVRSENMYRGEKIAPGSQVIFTEQEVFNDNVFSIFFHYSNAIVTKVDRDGLTCTIKLDNVRAQNEMIRNMEPSDKIESAQTPVLHISKESLGFWEEEADQIFVDFSEYVHEVRCAIIKAFPESDDSDLY